VGAARVLASVPPHTLLVNVGQRPPRLHPTPTHAPQLPPPPGRCCRWKEALWLATRGGARALALDEMVGSLEAGKEFDALVIDAGGGAGFDLFPGRDGPLQMLEKFLNNGDDRHIAAVYVQGRRVVGG